MGPFFQRPRRGADMSALGGAMLALRAAGTVPPGCVGVVADEAGRTTRLAAGARLPSDARAWCFHPGPYGVDLTPFAAAPEMGLRLTFAVDSPDPRVTQQRFDLFLASEGQESIDLAGFGFALDDALQRELAHGHLVLPPCTQADEWNAFRAGLNELLYTRFGITVDDCIPVDLAGQRDFAAMLASRALGNAPAGTAAPAQAKPVVGDGPALRRLFLELPALISRVRLLDSPSESFARQRAVVQRLDHVSLAVLTMPALDLSAPGVALPASAQQHRARHAARALSALDEAWALLARAGALDAAGMLDELERIAANLEHASAARRASGAAP